LAIVKVHDIWVKNCGFSQMAE